jgi:hypothetical protein
MPGAALQASRGLPRAPLSSECFSAMNYGEFWVHYLAAHTDPRCRAMHYAGTLAALVLLGLAGAQADWRWAATAIGVGYAPAWLGHAVFERNRPATFEHPLWSLVSDFRMLGLFLTGRLAGEFSRHQLGR